MSKAWLTPTVIVVGIAGFVLPSLLVDPVPSRIERQEDGTFARFALEIVDTHVRHDNPLEAAWIRARRVVGIEAIPLSGHQELIVCPEDQSLPCGRRVLHKGDTFECGATDQYFTTTMWHVAEIQTYGWAGLPYATFRVDCNGSFEILR